jgi:inorganic pyrophosphatase
MRSFITPTFTLLLSMLSTVSLFGQVVAPTALAAGLRQVDEHTLVADKHFVNDFESRPSPGLVNVVVEIPSGTNAKWEVDKKDGKMKWEIRDGKPRVVKYLSYPGNYGMIPRTLLSKEKGGDGDPLDILVLGPSQPRGSVVQARIIGVLKFLDGGEQDDKLIAVMPGTAMEGVNNFSQLKGQFNGALDIVELWFANYKGPGVMESNGIGGVEEANAILDAAIKSFDETSRPESK